MFWIGSGSAPKRHDAIADEFVERGVVPDDDIGDQAEIKIYRIKGFAGLFVEAFLGRLTGQFLLAHILSDARLALISQLGEAAHVGEHDRYLPASAAEGKGFGFEQ